MALLIFISTTYLAALYIMFLRILQLSITTNCLGTIEIEIYRMRIGLHYGRHCKVKGIAHLTTFELIIFLSLLLINAGDIELNPGPVTSRNYTGLVDGLLISSYFSVVHYNIQSILNKVDLLGSELRNFNIICLTEIWLGPNTTD